MIWEWLCKAGDVISCILCYDTVNLGRGLFFSFPLLALVMLLGKLRLFRNCFCRMVLWSFFLWLPFIGGLKFFYETKIGVRGFLWWADFNYRYFPIGLVYFVVIAVYGGYLFYGRRKLICAVKKMERLRENVHICDCAVTPFAVGLFSPKIVVPRVMVEEYDREDLETILFHEKMHIRLGHLWCLFVWDVLRVLFWPNFFMVFGMRALRADLEEMCDRVTIQKSGKSAWDYGRLLLACIRLIGAAKRREKPEGAAAFAGEAADGAYQEIRRRILKIAGFKRYKTINAVMIFAVGFILMAGGFFGIYRNSYARYTLTDDVMVLDDTGSRLLDDSERLRHAVCIYEDKVAVRTEEMAELLKECGAETEGIYILFGGFMKQPGVGGGSNIVYADMAQLNGERLEIAYEKNMDATVWIFMMM